MRVYFLIIILGIALIVALHYSLTFDHMSNTTINVTTTTLPVITTTTTTLPESVELSNGNITANIVTEETVFWLEQRTFDLVNEERAKAGLSELKWNEEIANVCKMHSIDMGINNFFSHTGTGNTSTSDRLRNSGIYYWNMSGENLVLESGMDYYTVNMLGDIRNVDYHTLEELAQKAVEGWMESPGHRENILKATYDESGMGLYVVEADIENSDYVNVTYYFTQDFITRTDCGYLDGPCCTTAGYLPWCYVPWSCNLGICK